MSERNKIIEIIKNAIMPLDYIYAMWEAGAAAFNRVDEWSDIDLYVVSDDDKRAEVFPIIEEALGEEFGIEHKYIVSLPPDNMYLQCFYRLKGINPFEVVDLAVFKLSQHSEFLVREIHGEAVFHFNKDNKVVIPEFDKEKNEQVISARLKALVSRFEMFKIFTEKEIHRGNFIEAFDFYRMFNLSPLIELLRIKYTPHHHGFRSTYIQHELPPEIVSRLASFYYIPDLDGLDAKVKESNMWIEKLLEKLVPFYENKKG